ncbi:MAG: SGNH/GDSL hydrolase family protein [Clostridia bacterium]|nr:SGNH/GDSL hydrolase family protein [Clostridia bacterium]
MKTICFFGDSITRRGLWLGEIIEHVYPAGIRVYNCGVSGDNATAAIDRLWCDCLSRTPDTVVMMFGMNDVGRDLYADTAVGKEAERIRRIERYKASIRTLAGHIRTVGAELILCTPTPYNDAAPCAGGENHTNNGLAACADFIRAYAVEIGVKCVDFFAAMRPMLGRDAFHYPDLVHPDPHGQHIMAQIFMREMGWIDTIDLVGTYTFTAPNQARFTVEQKLREIYFIEWNLMYGERKKRKLTHADKLALAEARLAAAREKGSEREIGWYAGYLAEVENKEEYESELVRLTLTM